MSKLDDIDYLVGLIFEHMYVKIPVRPIESKPLSTNYLEDLTIIKKMYEGKQLTELINTIFNTNISYIGKSESAYKFKRVDQVSDILLRVYPKDQEMNPSNSLNVDKIIAYLLSDLVIHKRTNNILINVCNVDIPAKDLQLFTIKYPEIKLDGMVSVTIREHFYKLVTLKEHLTKDSSVKNFKSSIFQVLNTLDIIQSMYPTFRHNNLTINTIMVYQMKNKSMRFKVSGKEFTIESSGEIKITNFLKSNIKNYIDNDSLDEKMQESNKYYDVDMFLESLLSLELVPEINSFIKRNQHKEMNAREIMMNDKLFKEEILDEQLGGKKKRSTKKRSSKNKLNKYSMSQDEVDNILSARGSSEDKNTPVENTLEYVNKQNKHKMITNPNDLLREEFANKDYYTTYNPPNKFESKPIDIPGTNLQLRQSEQAEPIIQIDVPQPKIEPNGLGGLLGTPDQPNSGIINKLGVNAPVSNWKLSSGDLHNAGLSISAKLQNTAGAQEQNIPLNIIPNPYKQINTNPHSILGMSSQQGGADRIIPIYKNTTNSPYKSNEQQRIQRERYIEQNPDAARPPRDTKETREDNTRDINYEERQPYRGVPLSTSAFELKIAPELLPPKQRPLQPTPPENVVKMMNYIIPNSIGNQTYSIANQFQQPSANVLSQNTYNITFANPSKVREFREDILPSKDESMLKYTMNTVDERLIIYQYLRSILIRQNDGENINFLSDKSPEVRNLLSYLRILDIQLTKYDKVNNNPLGVLPRRLVIYSSCYPIRVDRANYNVGCAKNNIGINIRIYQLVMGETFVNKYRTLPYKAFEVWREIAVYEQMRDNIVKSKISPNFALLYAYYITQDTEIDFLKINRLRNKEIINKKEKEQKVLLNRLYQQEMRDYLVGLQKYSTSDLTKLVEELDIHKPSNKCLIALTEAGTQDMISWGSRQYEDNGLAKKMINTGYHNYESWLSLLFQMYHSFLCMYKFGIAFQRFDLNSNVLVKSLKQDEMNKGYWKYRINGIDFYIPNYGYMILINNDFADIVDNDEQTLYNVPLPGRPGLPAHVLGLGVLPAQQVLLNAVDNTTPYQLDKINYKIYSNELLVKQTDVNVNMNKLRVIDNMKSGFDPNTFNKEFTLNGGMKPDDKIMRMIGEINVEINRVKTREEVRVNNAKAAEEAAYRADNKFSDEAIARIVSVGADYAPAAGVVNPAVQGQIGLEQTAKRDALAKKQADDLVVTTAAAAAIVPPAVGAAAANAAAIAVATAATATATASDTAAKAGGRSSFTLNSSEFLNTVIMKFKEFLHNRVGTSLKESERDIANLIEMGDLPIGELVACIDVNRWGIITQKNDPNPGDYTVFTVNENAGIDNNVTSRLQAINYGIGDLRRTSLVWAVN